MPIQLIHQTIYHKGYKRIFLKISGNIKQQKDVKCGYIYKIIKMNFN